MCTKTNCVSVNMIQSYYYLATIITLLQTTLDKNKYFHLFMHTKQSYYNYIIYCILHIFFEGDFTQYDSLTEESMPLLACTFHSIDRPIFSYVVSKKLNFCIEDVSWNIIIGLKDNLA